MFLNSPSSTSSISCSLLTVSAKVQNALSKSLTQRCSELENILKTTSAKELHNVFPSLIEHIFGFQNQSGWNLHFLTRHNNSSDFSAVKSFLCASGPLMKLIDKLLTDDFYRYEFPISCLPNPTKYHLEAGNIPVYYSNKLQYHVPGHPSNMLSLNAFEFFLFHLAYYLVNPQIVKSGLWSNPADLIYPILLEDYMNYFLPLNGKSTVLETSQSTTPAFSSKSFSSGNLEQGSSPRGSLMSFSGTAVMESPVRKGVSNIYLSPNESHSQHRLSTLMSPHLTSPTKSSPRLLKSSSYFQHAGPLPHSPVVTEVKDEQSWRFETFVQILVEFWLNQTSVDAETPRSSPISVENFLPSVDHVRVVRMFVKHLHYFANSAKDVILSPYQTHTQSPLEEFKRSIWPYFVQKRLYAFLKHGFSKWPLDSSFRMMLELWLSYIQPWRYTNAAVANTKSDDQNVKAIDPKWKQFISDNLLFYSGLFHELLPRLYRMDLGSPKNAYMLFRVCKVYGSQSLVDYLCEAEGSYLEPFSRHIGASTDLGGSFLSPNATHSVAMLTMQFAELECPGYKYKPLFGEETRSGVEYLLSLIAQAKGNETSSSKNNENGDGGFFAWLGLSPSVDLNTHHMSRYTNAEEFTPSDSHKLEAHLDQAAKTLCSIFSIEWIPNQHVLPTQPSYRQRSHSPERGQGYELTATARNEILDGLHKYNIRYQGDPELQPIRSDENAVMARLCYYFSSFLNEVFSDILKRLYNRNDLLGRTFHHLLLPPMSAVSPPGSKPSSPRLPQTPLQIQLSQQPRISLRFLAKYVNMAYIIILYLLLSRWLGIGPLLFIFFFISTAIFLSFIKAFMSPKKVHDR